MNPYLLVEIKQVYIPKGPHDYLTAFNLIKKLPHILQVRCALEAAKMVYHIWENYANNSYLRNVVSLSPQQKEAPKKAIEAVEKWLNGNATYSELGKRSEAALTSAEVANLEALHSSTHHMSSKAEAAADAAYTADAAACSVFKNDTANQAARATREGFRACIMNIPPTLTKEQFYTQWWNRCYEFITQEQFQEHYNNLCKQIGSDIFNK